MADFHHNNMCDAVHGVGPCNCPNGASYFRKLKALSASPAEPKPQSASPSAVARVYGPSEQIPYVHIVRLVDVSQLPVGTDLVPASELAKAQQERDALKAEVERLGAMVYLPGIWKCAKCTLELISSVLNAGDGNIYANTKPQECPNGCGPMWRVSERDQRKMWQALFDKELDKRETAERQLAQAKAEIAGLRADAERYAFCMEQYLIECFGSFGGDPDEVNEFLDGEIAKLKTDPSYETDIPDAALAKPGARE